MSKAFKTFIKGVKFTTSAAGTIGSLGTGGDTIPDLIFLIMDTGFMIDSFNRFTNNPYALEVSSIEWSDPKNIIDDTLDMLSEFPDEGIQELHDSYVDFTDSIVAIIANVVALLIPNDAGFGRLIVEELISGIITNSDFESLNNFWESLGDEVRGWLLDPSKLANLLYYIVDTIRSVLPNKSQGVMKRHSKTLLYGLIPIVGPALMTSRVAADVVNFGKYLDDIEDSIPDFVHLVQVSFVLLFAMTTIESN